ncbi:MAG: bifunctional biotin--[acetyl-CoA-carboxylase] ligase/biotin operon repressor BirA [Gammaproteobacteria bacterium]|nr:bifunctional biotin--[acetyl-CoA-carboxylase] ligase/biotin operon repressor BirA [Gammaproteobacteria bacterium]
MAKTVLLPLIADGEFHSGQELAAVLGVSRTAVWKQLAKLQDLGLEIESVRGKGYRINGGLELLDQPRIEAGLQPGVRSLLTELVVAVVLDSTNAEVLRRLQQGGGSGLVCLAEQQTAGRGRLGRQWISPFAGNIYLSLAWEFAGGAAALEGLSLAVGVAVARALQQFAVPDIALKWPNDILCSGAKLGGILIEMVGDAAGSCQVVIGIGLNVQMPARAGKDIDQRWTDIRTALGTSVSRNQIVIALLDQLLPLLGGYEDSGFSPWRERWLVLDAHAGKDVIVVSGDRRTAGTARGIDETGALVLDTALGRQLFHGGEVSVRAVE